MALIDKLRFHNILTRGGMPEPPALEFTDALQDTFDMQLEPFTPKTDLDRLLSAIGTRFAQFEARFAQFEARIEDRLAQIDLRFAQMERAAAERERRQARLIFAATANHPCRHWHRNRRHHRLHLKPVHT